MKLTRIYKKYGNKIILFGIIILICAISIAIVLYRTLFIEKKNNENIQIGTVDKQLETQLKDGFQNIFNNKLNTGDQTEKSVKKDSSKEIVYTALSNADTLDSKYELNVHIPYINMDGETIEKYNSDIQNIFSNKVSSILTKTELQTIFHVKYASYINNGIFSLVIHATLKEGDNPQRVIIKTYNYDIENQKEVTVKEILELKGINLKEAQTKILEEIEIESRKSNTLKELGYSVYERNIGSDTYQIENSNNFFLGKDACLYVIYAYGNNNYTSEIDLVLF